jgi:hypothetical protein
MAQRWKMAAGMVASLGMTWTLHAQTPPPPLPIGPSSLGGPVMMMPMSAQGTSPMGPMAPSGPMGSWTPPMPGGGPGGHPGHSGAPMQPEAPCDDKGLPELDFRSARSNAFNGEDGGDYRPISHQFNAEYLILWFKGHRHPPLVTTGDITDDLPGALGEPGTVIEHGQRSGPGSSSALRLTYTYWLVDPEIVSIDSSFFIMEQRRLPFTLTSDNSGNPVISRPYFDPVANTQSADPRAVPFTKRGTVEDNFLTRLMGAEANLKYNVTGVPSASATTITVFTGPRWIRLDEKYFNQDFSQDIPAGSGQSFIYSDNFTCYNEVVGGQIGATFRRRWDRLALDVTSKLGVGQNYQTVKISGSTVQRDDTLGEITVANNQGLFAQPTNVGIYHREQISVVPEINLNVGFYLNDNCKFSVGWGLFHMSNVVRPGALLDPRINIQPLNSPTPVPPLLPQPRLNSTDFWAQWINFGLEISF